MQFVKEQGYGGVIIWSLDLDDKTGEVCKEGPFPIFNAAKRELTNLPEHLMNRNKKCSDDNATISIEHLHSKTTHLRVKSSKNGLVVDWPWTSYSRFRSRSSLSFLLDPTKFISIGIKTRELFECLRFD